MNVSGCRVTVRNSATNYNNNDNKHIFRFMCHVHMFVCELYTHHQSPNPYRRYCRLLSICTCRHVYLLHSKLKKKKTTYSNFWQKTEKNIHRSTRFTAKHKCKRIRVNEKSDMHAVRETNNNNSNINCKWLKLYAPNIQIKGHVYFPLISFRCCCLLSLLMPFVIHKTCSCFFSFKLVST